MKCINIHFPVILVFIFILGCGGMKPDPRDVIPVENALQEAGDMNRNGVLEEQEARQLAGALKKILRGPGEITHAMLGPLFDYRTDGRLDEQEVEDGRNLLMFDFLQRLPEFNPEDAEFFDENDNGRIDQHESQAIKDYLFNPDDPINKPGQADNFWRDHQDRNGDGLVDMKELEWGRDRIFRLLVTIPLPFGEFRDEGAGNDMDGQGFPVRGQMDEILDINRDGYVDRFEVEQSAVIFNEFDKSPQEVHDPDMLEARYDLNDDGFISKEELQQVYRYFGKVKEKVRQIIKQNDGFQVGDPLDRVFDLNNDGFVSINEMRNVAEAFKTMEKRPHEVKNDIDRQVDFNDDDRVSLEEIREIANRISMLRKEYMRVEEEIREGHPVENLLHELADTNDDGFLDPGEIEIMQNSIFEPHLVESEFDHRIDFNDNGEVEIFELEKARRTESVRLDENREDGDERYSVETPIDEIFDLNDDGFIGPREIDEIIGFFVEGSHRVKRGFKLDVEFDLDGDGYIHEEEMLFILENYLRPHSANYDEDIDRQSDRNEDDFIDPDEIGVAAGVTSSGDRPPFEEMINNTLARLESEKDKKEEWIPGDTEIEMPESTPTPEVSVETTKNGTTIFQKKIDIKNKKLAVVSLDGSSLDTGDDPSEAIIMFVENAFVNMGNAKVVDRTSINKIVDEYKFQASDLSDDTTAVKIGQLAGAEIIVTGKINYVGKKYYLNIKLISVETAEIMGSSIDTAINDTEFYEMCNSAVYKLF